MGRRIRGCCATTTGARCRTLTFQRLESRALLAATPAAADFDGDGRVAGADFLLWQTTQGDAINLTTWSNSYGETAENLTPVALNDVLDVNYMETAVILPAQLLANDCDDGPLEIIGVSGVLGGAVELRDGLVFATPNTPGEDVTFDYTVADSTNLTASATATLSQTPPVHSSPDDQTRAAEHRDLFTLIDAGDATIVAVQDGPWSTAETWSTGAAPTAGDRVLIHNTVAVTYDEMSDAPLDWLRVDGTLSFQHDASTQLRVETFASDPRGTINVGTAAQAIEADVTAEILIDTAGGPLSQTEDPTLVGRGFISHGATNIFGAEKTEITTLLGDATAGANFLELTDGATPSGWMVGDTLLVAGTEVDASLLNNANQAAAILAADAENARFRDELLEITSMSVVDGRIRVFFENITNQAAVDEARTTLLWNHVRPMGETFASDELSIHVANLTRNIVVRSSDPTVDIQQRGHFMVMHNVNAEIHHALFKDLGRTNKRLVVDDPAAIGNMNGSPATGSNPRGRYGLHLHRLGANSLDGPRALVTGNVVWGTPGWGIVQHDSHATLADNVVFDVVGAGIVAEDGNELGLWRNNLVVKTTGDLVNNFDDGAFFQTQRGPQFDLGFFGSGYWVQGGGFGIRMEDNVAASANGAAFDLVHNTDGLANVEQIAVDLIADPAIRQAIVDAGFEQVTPNNIPTRGVDGLTAYNSFRGIHTWLHNRDSGDMESTFTFPTFLAHDFRSIIQNYAIWGVQSGVQNFYSTRFDFANGLIVGNVDNPVPYFASLGQQANNSSGIGVSHNHAEANNILFDGLRLEGFEYGFQVFSPLNEAAQEISPYATSELRNASFANVEHAFSPTNGSNPASQAHRFSDLFVLDEASAFTTLGAPDNLEPTAAFGYLGGAGLSIVLDAAGSFDSDPSPEVRAADDGIAAYAWDLDNDGLYDDAFGESLTYVIPAAGDYQIGLKVWDDDGATATVNDVVSVAFNGYDTPWDDGDFSAQAPFGGEYYRFGSTRRGEGWIARDVVRNAAGFAEIGTPQFGLGALGQTVRDERVRRGRHTFSFDVINDDALDQPNLLRVSLFGVNGQWDLNDGTPAAVHAMNPPQVTTLVDVNQGAVETPNWQTQSFDVDLGSDGFEYLVIAVEFQAYAYAQGDYFALDNFAMTETATTTFVPALATSGPTSDLLDNNATGNAEVSAQWPMALLPANAQVGVSVRQLDASNEVELAPRREPPTLWAELVDSTFDALGVLDDRHST